MDAMTNIGQDQAGLLAAEESRRKAMLACDTQVLGDLLSDALLYVHSTGLKDSKQSYLEKLASRALRYESLAFVEPVATLLGDTGLVSAVMQASVLSSGGLRKVASSYLAVWLHTPAGWCLQAVQATPLPVTT